MGQAVSLEKNAGKGAKIAKKSKLLQLMGNRLRPPLPLHVLDQASSRGRSAGEDAKKKENSEHVLNLWWTRRPQPWTQTTLPRRQSAEDSAKKKENNERFVMLSLQQALYPQPWT